MLTRLMDVSLVEALRSTSSQCSLPGLLRGLADDRIGMAMQQMHGSFAQSLTVAQIAKKVAMSSSAFFNRFMRTVGLAPIEYLLAWHMAGRLELAYYAVVVAIVMRHAG